MAQKEGAILFYSVCCITLMFEPYLQSLDPEYLVYSRTDISVFAAQKW